MSMSSTSYQVKKTHKNKDTMLTFRVPIPEEEKKLS